MNNNICGICINVLSPNENYRKWNCHHYFHKVCADSWNNGCPICRTQDLIENNNSNITKSHNLNLDILNTFDSANYYQHYYEKWKYTECKTYNHKLKFVNCRTPPFGVLGFCKKCDLVQPFNRFT